MRLFVSLILILCTSAVQALELSPRQLSDLQQGAERMQQALQDGDIEALVAQIFTPALELAGGNENVVQQSERMLSQYQRPGYSIESVSVSEPEIVVAADPYVVAFLPTTTILKTSMNKHILSGFVVGVLSENKKRWSFFDGALTQANINLLYELLPNLPLDIVLPAIRTQSIENTDNYIAEGISFSKLKRYEQAISLYNRAIDIDPQAEMFVMRSDAYRELGDSDQAIADATRAIEMQPGYIFAHLQRGQTYFEMRQFDKALKDFDQAAQLDSKNIDAHYFRALTNVMLGNCKSAIEDYSKVIKNEPDNELAYTRRAECYLKDNKIKKAIKDAQKAINLDPSYQYAQLVMGQIQIANGKVQQGCASYRAACIFADCIPSHMKQEKQVCEKLVRDNPQISGTANGRSGSISVRANKVLAQSMDISGVLDTEAGDIAGGISFLQNVDTSKWNEFEKAQLSQVLGSFYVQLENYPQAILEYEKYVRTLSIPRSNALNVAYSLAQLYLAVENYDEAVKVLNFYLPRVANPSPEVVFTLGQAYFMADYPAQASTYVSTAVEMKEISDGRASETWYKFQYAIYFELKDIARVVSILRKMDSFYPSEETKALIEKLTQ